MENPKRYSITLDDDPTVAKIIGQATGISSLPFTSSAALIGRASSYEPVAVFIDVHLDVDDCGLDAIPTLRCIWPSTPIIVVTSDPLDTLVGSALARGANDFIRKPINIPELQGRLHARIAEMVARRESDEIVIGSFRLSKSRATADYRGKTANLTRFEAQLLMLLLENRNMTVERPEIKSRLWGKIKVSENTLDKKLSQLRKSLADVNAPFLVETVYGKGAIIRINDENKSETVEKAPSSDLRKAS